MVEKLLPVVQGVQTAEEARSDTVVAPSKVPEDSAIQDAVADGVETLGVLPGRAARLEGQIHPDDKTAGDIVAVRQANVFGTSFHPELTSDMRIHLWWLRQLVEKTPSTGAMMQ